MYEYVPFGSTKVIELPLETSDTPFSVTDQLVVDGSPVSVNVIAYVVGALGVNVIVSVTAAPFTVTEPDDGLAE